MSAQRDYAPPVRRTMILTGVLLLILLFVGNWASQQISFFDPDDIVVNPNAAYVQTTAHDSNLAVFAPDITLDASITGDVIFGAGSITLNESIDGHVTAIGGEIIVNGTISDDVLIAGEQITLNGDLTGDAVIFAQDVILNTTTAPNITVCAENLTQNTDITLRPCDHDTAKTVINRAGGQIAGLWLISLLNNTRVIHGAGSFIPLPIMLFLTAVAVLMVVIFPRRMETIESTLRVYPSRMLLTGTFVLLLMIGMSAAMILLVGYTGAIGLLALPVYLLLLAGFVVLVLMGWMSLILFVGGWLVRRFSQSPIPPMVQVVIGGGLFAVGLLLLSFVPINWLAPLTFLLVNLVGLGATYTTQLGRRVVTFNTKQTVL